MRRKLQIIFQDSHASLNPRMPIGDLVGEALDIHGLFPGAARRRPHPRASRHGRPRRPSDRTLSARIERRPGAAGRDLPRARRRTRADRLRRAGLGARRLDPGADREPAAGPAGAPGPCLHLHLARSQRRPSRERRHRRDVPRQDRRAGRQGRDLRSAGPSLHQVADVGGAGARSRHRGPAPAHHPEGRPAQSGRPALGLPLPHALPGGHSPNAPRSTRCSTRSRRATGPSAFVSPKSPNPAPSGSSPAPPA